MLDRRLITSFLAVLATALSASPAQAVSVPTVSAVTFLGADPEFVIPSPVAIANLNGGGIDAAGNGYFVNGKAGTILKVTPEGVVGTLLSGLKDAHMAADYRGDVFVSDTGNNRVLSLAAGATEPTVRAKLTAPGSIVADVNDDFFFLSGSELYEIIRGGEARRIGQFPGATLLAYGPATGENDTIYILSASGGIATGIPGMNPESVTGIGVRYSVSTYSYHNTSGTIATGRSFQATEKIQEFGVDAAGNLIFAGVETGANGQSNTYLFEIATTGDKLALTSPIAGSNIHFALDYNRNIYYTDAQGVYKLMKGSIDFGSATQGGGGADPSLLTLNFMLPTGAAVASTAYIADGAPSYDFADGFATGPTCSNGSACSVQVAFFPANLGITAATLSLLDTNGKTLIQVRLHGVGIYPVHELFVDNNVATSYAPINVSLKSPSGICNSSTLGPVVTDVKLGTLLTPYSSALDVAGLGKPETVAHVAAGNTYTTQAGTAGVLTIHPDGTQTRTAPRLTNEPNGVDVDGAGNLYISDHNSIFRVGVDGTEAQLADPSTDDGYESVQSIAADPVGNVYAFFSAGGPTGNGGLLKITPAGVATAIPTEAKGAAGLALDSGGGLYFSDGVTRALETQRADGTWMTMLSGLKKPKGVTGLFGPLLVDQGSAQLLAPTMPQSAFDFGNVPVGTTATKRFIVYALGNGQSSGELYFDGTDQAFSGSGYLVDPGGAEIVTISFTPTFPGPHNVQLYDEANDYYSEQPIRQQYTVTGVGVEPAN